MKNFNKFTKAELISKIKGLKNNPQTQSKFIDYFYMFKTFIVKISFLALIFKIFKQFKIIRRLWLLINTIVMSIFGISMLDLYGLSIISAFISEITVITGNIVNYLTNTKFYTYLVGWLNFKKETPIETPTKIEPAPRIQPEIQRNEFEIKRDSKVASWFESKSEEKIEVIEDSPFYKNKYFIWGTIFIASCLTYYYFGDEIKDFTSELFNLFRRPGNNPPRNPQGENLVNPVENPRLNPSSNNKSFWDHPIANIFGLNKDSSDEESFLPGTDAVETHNSSMSPELREKLVKKFYRETETESKIRNPIPGPSNFNSPSLDDLNRHAQETFERTASPKSSNSSSSTETIKASDLPPVASTSGQIPKATVEDLEEVVNKIDQAFNKNGNVNPFIGHLRRIKNLSEDNWINFVNPGIKERMDIVKNLFDKEFSHDEAIEMSNELMIIIKSYEEMVYALEINRDKMTKSQIKAVKHMSFFMRSWISDYSSKILTKGKITIETGTILDTPKNIMKDILND